WAMCMPMKSIIADAPQKCIPRRKLPNGASYVMNCKLAYASPVDVIYADARAIPVTTCTINEVSVAVPNTYHQSVPGGTGCSNIGPTNSLIPERSSSQCQKLLNGFISPQFVGTLTRWNVDTFFLRTNQRVNVETFQRSNAYVIGIGLASISTWPLRMRVG